MKKITKNIFGIVLALAIIISSLSVGITALAAPDFTVVDGIIGNEYIEIAVGEPEQYIDSQITPVANFTLGTTGGDPLLSTDNYKKLLFGHPSPWSSYTTVVVDNGIYRYGELYTGGSYLQVPTFDAQNGSNTSVVQYGDIVVKQTLRIIRNSATGRKDLVEIKYDITNKGSVAHEVGTRIMLDTMLGGNDSAPFRVPGTGDVVTQTEYIGDDIPQYWQVFDSLTNPTVVAQGTFATPGNSNKPDRVQFTNWGRVNNNEWDEPVTSGENNGDSAVTVTWNKKFMAPNETRTYATYYGLSRLEIIETDRLSLSLFAPAEINVENNAYDPNPTTITAYVKNTSSDVVEDVKVSLDLVAPLSMNGASQKEILIGEMAAGEERQVSWFVDIAESGTQVTVPVTATVSGTDADSVAVTKDVIVPELKNVYTLTYYAGTEVFSQKQYYEGQNIVAVSEIPSLKGHSFVEWIDADTGVAGIPATMPARDVNLEASFEPSVYNAVFMVDGAVYATVSTEYATAIELPADPTMEDMIFTGWTPEIPATMPANDCEFNATWIPVPEYTVTYYVGTEIFAQQQYKEGKAVVAPSEIPSVEGYSFVEWVDADTGDAGLPESMPARDVTLVASLKANVYNAVFMVNGAVYATVPTEYATAIEIPADPEMKGMMFAGWTPAVPAAMPANDCVFNATWISTEKYTAAYMVDGKTYAAFEVLPGDPIPVPADPQKCGFKFKGWNPSVPEIMPEADLVFEAEWEVDLCLVAVVVGGTVVGATAIGVASSNAAAITTVSVVGGVASVWILGKYVVPELIDSHKVTYMVDSKTYRVYLVKTGEPIEVPENPVKDGAEFAGWTPEIPEVMPDHDLVFEAEWVETEAKEESLVDVFIPQTGSAMSMTFGVTAAMGLAIAAIAVFRKKKED